MEFTEYGYEGELGISPILRAGLGMETSLLELFPDAKVFHLGLFR